MLDDFARLGLMMTIMTKLMKLPSLGTEMRAAQIKYEKALQDEKITDEQEQALQKRMEDLENKFDAILAEIASVRGIQQGKKDKPKTQKKNG